jgi:hypothetical protein
VLQLRHARKPCLTANNAPHLQSFAHAAAKHGSEVNASRGNNNLRNHENDHLTTRATRSGGEMQGLRTTFHLVCGKSHPLRYEYNISKTFTIVQSALYVAAGHSAIARLNGG